MRITALVAVCTGLSACDEESELDDLAHESRSDYAPPINFGLCPTYLCGMNAGVSGSLSFHIDGFESLDGLVLYNILDPEGGELELELDGDRLWASDPEGEILSDEDLVGVEIVVQDVETLELTSLYIDAFTPDAVESARFPGVFYPTYEFSVLHHDDEPDERYPLCGPGPWTEAGEAGEGPDFEPETHAALVIQGEAFDWWGDLVDDLDEHQDDVPAWFTIGCSGGAYAKKILMGYDVNNPEDLRPTHAESETFLKMLTARYCSGASYTTTGVPLRWQNEPGDFEVIEGLPIEAIWDPEGALCLNTPRWVTRAEVEAECGPIPTCAEIETEGHYLTSYNVD